AADRCVGIGECRRMDGATMCPSYRATREEMHSTRGRARLLHEMVRGELPMWKSPEVHQALDLCLSCKGCKSDCPVNVDMATYKAEFLSHHYRGRLRPRPAYAFGLVHTWVRLAALAPALVNFVMRAPILAQIVKWLAGISQKRRLPKLARVTFRTWWRQRARRNEGRPPVILWP